MRIAALGFPCGLIALASQEYLRGVARLRLPLLVLLATNLINLAALRSLTGTGAQIFVRGASLSAAFLVASALLAHVGSASLAAHQIAFQLWYLLALALSALAIAAQVVVSHHLAIGNIDHARQLAERTMVWSFIAGCCFAVTLFAAGGVLPELSTQSPPVINRAHAVWPIVALLQPFSALAFVLDSILIGVGDTRFCMGAMPAAAAIGFAPLAILSTLLGWGLVGIWLALFGLIVARLVLYMAPFRGETWADHWPTARLSRTPGRLPVDDRFRNSAARARTGPWATSACSCLGAVWAASHWLLLLPLGWSNRKLEGDRCP